MADMSNYVTAKHIATQAGAYEPQRTFNFTLITSGPTAGGNNQTITGGAANNEIALALYSLKLPKFGTELVTIEFGNEVRKAAGKMTFESMSMQCVDYVDKDVAKRLYDWKMKSGDPRDGKIGTTNTYKALGSIFLFGPDGSGSRKFECFGLWPREVDHGEGNMSTNDKVLISVTFEVDRIVPSFV